MKSSIKQLIVLLAFVLVSAEILATSQFEEQYLANLKNGSLSLKVETCKKIYANSGVTDKRIFDALENALMTTARAEKPSREQITAAQWYAKALSVSGDLRYQPSFEAVAEKGTKWKLRRQARKSLEELKKFNRWNPTINSNEYEMQGRPKSMALWMRMVASGEADMGRHAIKQASTFAQYDLNFLILLEDEIRKVIPQANLSNEKIEFTADAMHYLMSHPEFGKYTFLINEVAELAKNKRVVRAARKALNQ